MMPAAAHRSPAMMTRIRRHSAAAIVLVLAAAVMPAVAAAAPEANVRAPLAPGTVPDAVASKRVERMQRALAELGYYDGVVDGRMNAATANAVADFRQDLALAPGTGITHTLVERAERFVQEHRLAHRLSEKRRQDKAKARRTVMSDGRLRSYLAAPQAGSAEPSATVAACAAPTAVDCLLAAALQAARTVADEARRDWAYSEILAAQSAAGRDNDARATLALIGDARLQLTGLRTLAAGQAARGRTDAALETASLIPDAVTRAAALADITEANPADPRARGRLAAAIAAVHDPLPATVLHARAAVIAMRAGDTAAVLHHRRGAERSAAAVRIADERRTAGRHLATMYAELGLADEAAATARRYFGGDSLSLTPVLLATAEVEAWKGDVVPALAAADAITERRYRAAALGAVAQAQVAADSVDAAAATLKRAFETAAPIRLPYARSNVLARLAHASIDLERRAGGSLQSIELRAAEVADPALRAGVLLALAEEYAARGDRTRALATQDLAEKTLKRVTGDLDRVWVLAETAERQTEAGRPEAARQAIARGADLAKGIKSPWGRSRAFGRLALAAAGATR